MPCILVAFTNEYFSTCTHGETKLEVRDIGLQSDSRAEHAALCLVIFSEERKVFSTAGALVVVTV